MSLNSMTGFGRGEARRNGVSVQVELNSVNRKQLDIQVVVPKPLLSRLHPIHEEIRKVLHRGRITGEIVITWSAAAQKRSVRIDENLLSAYTHSMKHAAKKLNVEDNLGIEYLTSLPQVIQYRVSKQDGELLWSLTQKAMQSALRQLLQMRRREGQAMKKDLLDRLDILATVSEKIGQRAPQVKTYYQKQILKRLKEAGVTVKRQDERIQKELFLFAERADITEELIRLKSHFQQVRRLMNTKQPSGRSLDFLAQELFREINTIGSKANDVKIATWVIEFKSELEKIREQLQNVE